MACKTCRLDPITIKKIVEVVLGDRIGTYTYPNGFVRPSVSIGNPPAKIKAQGLEVIIPLFPDTPNNRAVGRGILSEQFWEIYLVKREGTTAEDFIESADSLIRTFINARGYYTPQLSEIGTYEQYTIRFKHWNNLDAQLFYGIAGKLIMAANETIGSKNIPAECVTFDNTDTNLTIAVAGENVQDVLVELANNIGASLLANGVNSETLTTNRSLLATDVTYQFFLNNTADLTVTMPEPPTVLYYAIGNEATSTFNLIIQDVSTIVDTIAPGEQAALVYDASQPAGSRWRLI